MQSLHSCAPPQALRSTRSTTAQHVFSKSGACRTLAAGFGFGPIKRPNKGDKACPCGSGQPLKGCCGPYLDSADTAAFRDRPPTAEACLRARFSAYALKAHWRLIMKTTSSDSPTRKGSVSKDGQVVRKLENDIKVSQQWADFSGLQVLDTQVVIPGQEERLRTQYTIKQKFEQATGQPIKNPQAQVIKETATFCKEGSEGWVFLRADSNWDSSTMQATDEAITAV